MTRRGELRVVPQGSEAPEGRGRGSTASRVVPEAGARAVTSPRARRPTRGAAPSAQSPTRSRVNGPATPHGATGPFPGTGSDALAWPETRSIPHAAAVRLRMGDCDGVSREARVERGADVVRGAHHVDGARRPPSSIASLRAPSVRPLAAPFSGHARGWRCDSARAADRGRSRRRGHATPCGCGSRRSVCCRIRPAR